MRLAACGLLLEVLWELGQSPLYADHARGAAYVAWTRLHCAGGDVLILLATFWTTSLAVRSRGWWAVPRWGAIALFTLLGFAYTVWSEWFNTGVRGTWAYAPAMPRLLGLGLAPLLQWLVLPPALLALLRRTAPPTSRTRPTPDRGHLGVHRHLR